MQTSMENKSLLVITSAPNTADLKYSITAEDGIVPAIAYDHDGNKIESSGTILPGGILIIQKLAYTSDMQAGQLPYIFRAWFVREGKRQSFTIDDPDIEIKNCLSCALRIHEAQQENGKPFIDMLSEVIALPGTDATVYLANDDLPAERLPEMDLIEVPRRDIIPNAVRPPTQRLTPIMSMTSPLAVLIIIIIVCLLVLLWRRRS
jgi:hypothetical protein